MSEYQATTKKHKHKRASTNSRTDPQGRKTVNQLRNTASDEVNGSAENPMCA